MEIKLGYDEKNAMYWGQINYDDGEISGTTGNTWAQLCIWASEHEISSEDFFNHNNWIN